MTTPPVNPRTRHTPTLALPQRAVHVADDGTVSWEPEGTAAEHGHAPDRWRRTGALGTGERAGVILRGEAGQTLRALLGGELPEELAVPGLPHQESLAGTVQLVYIDPPYNTGGSFADYSDKVDHALWLAMLRERLELLRTCLAETGSLWLHVDDSEMAYAKVLCDEVFGRENLVSAIVVENNPKGRQLGKFFAGSHDHLLCYARDIRRVRVEPGTREAVNPADFPKSDERGPYRHLPLRNTNKKFHPGTVPTLHYPLWANPDTGMVAAEAFDGAREVWPVFGDGRPAVWRWSAARVRERGDELTCRIVRGRAGERLDVFQIDRLTGERTKKLRSIWMAGEIGSSDSAKSELKKVLPWQQIFATPKPEPLLRRVIEATTAPGDLVLDCFAGSGTTAVVAHRLGRRYVAVELSQATVDTHIVPRLDKEAAAGAGGQVVLGEVVIP